MAAIIVLLFAGEVDAKTATEIFEKASKSTVIVLNYNHDAEVVRFGSGVFLPNGKIATNCHVVKDASSILVYYQGKKYLANKRFSLFFESDTCSKNDICILEAKDIKAPPVTFGNTSRLKVGTRVYTIGAPKGLELTLSEGVISSLRETDGGRYIQTTAPISPGSSGGGLFDEDGRLIGLMCFFLKEGQNLNFALPVEWISDRIAPPKSGVNYSEIATHLERMVEAHDLERMKAWHQIELNSLHWIKEYPDDYIYWEYLGIAYRESGRTVKAMEAFERAIRLAPKSASALYHLSLTYRESGQIAKAAEVLEKAYAIDPEYGGFWYGDARGYYDSRQWDKTIKASQQILRLNPKNLPGWTYLGIAYGISGQSTKAIDAYKQALSIDPEYYPAWMNLGHLYQYLGQTKKVMEVYTLLKKINPAVADDYFKKVVLP
jgi:tetratricopeptide (TPR) repeat protein